ncbi:hypothetical protein C8J57DRAFT_1545208 [Mycena rebaudengoi]|nr:hypothetical protein C8J57DRAFT_1546025 [Mycena rebaudengoi]KAJ7199280.1 hypothetical protein C8J57DRAFT_1545208 [Mycena rebaudengoi]
MSVIRCLPGSDSGCTVPWDMHYSSSATSLTRPSIDSISQESDALYRDLRVFIRPCTACATMIIRGARLIALEQQIKDGRYPAISADQLFADPLVHRPGHHLTKAVSGYSASDYAVDRRFTGKTAPIYVSAIQCASLLRGNENIVRIASGVHLECYIRAEVASGRVFPRYDALEYFEWSSELSLGNLYWPGTFTRLGGFIPELGRVDRRHYDTDTQLWAHPFRAEWAAAVDNLQLLPFTAEELSTVYRTYTVNGLIADRSLRHLAPDCFSHTGFTAEDVVRIAREHAERLQAHVQAQARDSDELAALGRLFGIDATLSVVPSRTMTLNSSTVFQTRLFG